VGVDGEDPPPGRKDLVGTRGRVAVGVVFFALYTLTFGLRGDLLAGLVGGALGGLLFFLLLREAEERRRRRRR
jgi:membrane associated rhomboid family serine protease